MSRVLLVLLAGALLAGCGGKDTDPSRFLSNRDASFLNVRVDQAESANQRAECSDARGEVSRALGRIDEIEARGRVSKRLMRNLRDWFQNLRSGIADECGRDEPSRSPTEEPEETPTPDTETETEPEETPTPDRTPTPLPTPSRTPTPDPTETPDNGGASPEPSP